MSFYERPIINGERRDWFCNQKRKIGEKSKKKPSKVLSEINRKMKKDNLLLERASRLVKLSNVEYGSVDK